jgi:DNA-binding NtrC family response regulator
MQSHLLRVLQDRTFYRVGGTQEVRTDVRFIAATNKDLKQAIRQGTFREDLYFRLAVITIALPPLRERMEDLSTLVEHFLNRPSNAGLYKRVTLSDETFQTLQQYPWPGNVRELENVLTRALILCPGDTIGPEHLSLTALTASTIDAPMANQEADTDILFFSYHKSMDIYGQKLIEDALRRNGWNQTKAAAELGLQRTYLTKLLRQKQITGKPPTPSD